jgi:hypothetical protein
MNRNLFIIAKLVVASAMVTLLAGCGGGGGQGPANVPYGIKLAIGYSISVFAKAPLATQRPDSIVQGPSNTVFVAYQNAGEVKDGSVPGITNAVVQYDLSGNLLKTYTVPGHCDGLLLNDSTHLWAMANEDGNPILTIIDLSSGNQTSYTPTVPTAHGGGFDDMQLINGVVYVSASNPSTPGAAPTVVSLTLNPNGTTFDVAPVLAGNAQALDITPSIGGSPNPTYNQMVTLALTDPDSEATDPAGNLVLDSQADARLIFIHNPGPNQTVSVLILTLFNDKDGPNVPVDDTRFVPPAGPTGQVYMLVTDAFQTTYRLDGPFMAGTPYSNGQGQIMQLDLKTGHLNPVATSVGDPNALRDPHGMLFIAL